MPRTPNAATTIGLYAIGRSTIALPASHTLQFFSQDETLLPRYRSLCGYGEKCHPSLRYDVSGRSQKMCRFHGSQRVRSLRRNRRWPVVAFGKKSPFFGLDTFSAR